MSRPFDLKRPFSWPNRQILVQEGVWYVPDQFDDFASFTFPGWEHPTFFENKKPICIEYCSGNGDWIQYRAQVENHFNWVAIERKFDRVRKIWSKMKNAALSNLLPVCGEGYRITKNYIPNNSVQAVYINFPDPWPKNRHAKNRIIQKPFAEELLRIIAPGGTLTLVTDDSLASEWMIDTLKEIKGFKSQIAPPYYTFDYPNYGTSYFENLWREQGKQIRYMIFMKDTL